jgi:hypothetical protein
VSKKKFGFSLVYQRFSSVFLWFFFGLPEIFLGFLWFSFGLPEIFFGFSLVYQRFSLGFL